jgi:hypothetical protein
MDRSLILIIKIFHLFLFILSSILLAILLYEVIKNEITIIVWITSAMFIIEGIVLIINGWKCPITQYTEKLGPNMVKLQTYFYQSL